MLEKVWRKGNPPKLLEKMQVDAATVENNMDLSSENLKENYHIIQKSHFLGIYPDKTVIQKDTCISMFIAALFTKPRH